jgi:hypothetical protein
MTEKTKKTENENGSFVFYRGDVVESFVCERCMKSKTAKIKVDWTDSKGQLKVICNGCYGRLQSPVPL